MLSFRPHEKNLFGQVRSWSAASGDGMYVIERGVTGEQYQARYQPRQGRPIPLQDGAWLPTFAQAQALCNTDGNSRMRQRIIAKARKR